MNLLFRLFFAHTVLVCPRNLQKVRELVGREDAEDMIDFFFLPVRFCAGFCWRGRRVLSCHKVFCGDVEGTSHFDRHVCGGDRTSVEVHVQSVDADSDLLCEVEFLNSLII